MSESNVRMWVNSLPKIERNQPLVISGGRAYTPNEVLAEIREGSATGAALQRKVETHDFTAIEEEYALAILRVKERLRKLPESFKIASIDGEMYSPSQMLEEIEKGTAAGREMVEAEMSRLEEVTKT